MQGNEASTARRWEAVQTEKKSRLMKKIHGDALKKLYESKIASLADQKMPAQLLRIMCQDVSAAKENLDSRWGRKLFVKKCLRYYRSQIREIERAESGRFLGLF